MTLATARDLHKSYGATAALDGFDLDVPEGAIVGLIGPNGSGKTTALRALTGLLGVDRGELRVLDQDPWRSRAQLMRETAYIADVGTLPRWMRVRDLLDFVAGVHPGFDPAAARATLSRTEVREHARVGELSKGMTAQLHLALVMATAARLLVLDEPTLGLDLLYRRRFYEVLLSDYFEEGRAILLSTHEISEIEHLLTHVVFIARGRTVLQASVEELAERFISVTAPQSEEAALKELGPLSLRRTLHGLEAVFDGIDPARLPPQAQVRPSDLSGLFVAVLGGTA
ncbi:MAG: ABC transporter ATP-binding protein [Pseudomonadota bacterium]